MNIVQRQGLAGYYRAELIGRDGKVRFDTGVRKNLILNQGFNRLVSRTNSSCRFFAIDQLVVGTGNNAPEVTDTGLQTFLARLTTSTASVSHGDDGTTAWARLSRVYLFDFAEAIGNLTELGVEFASSSNLLFARSLFRDGDDNPITIEKTADDQLRITYTIEIQVAMSEEVDTIDVTVDGSPVSTTLRSRPQSIGNMADDVGGGANHHRIMDGPGLFNVGSATFYPDNTPPANFTGAGPSSTSNSLGVAFSGSTGNFIVSSGGGETDGVWWVTRLFNMQPSSVVTGNEIGAISLNSGTASQTAGAKNWLLLFNPKIPKDNTRRLQFRQTIYYTRA